MVLPELPAVVVVVVVDAGEVVDVPKVVDVVVVVDGGFVVVVP